MLRGGAPPSRIVHGYSHQIRLMSYAAYSGEELFEIMNCPLCNIALQTPYQTSTGFLPVFLLLIVCGFIFVATRNKELTKRLLFWLGVILEAVALLYCLSGSGNAISFALVGMGFMAASKVYP